MIHLFFGFVAYEAEKKKVIKVNERSVPLHGL
jgi:hypothetical protein